MSTPHRLIERLPLALGVLRATPIVALEDERLQLFAKLDFLNGIGSIKDRPALWILRRAIERGEIGPDTTIVESSSGNFACALAAFARLLELKFVAVIDPNIAPANEALLRSYCHQVVKVAARDETGGYLTTRLSTVERIMADLSDAYWPNQYGNPDGMDAHYQLTAAEIIEALPTVDYVFIGVSSAGTIAGVSRRLKEHNPQVTIVAVDAEGSVIFGQPPKPRWIPGLGSSITPPLLRHAVIDDVVVVSETETIAACRELLSRHGLFVGGSSGSAYRAVQRYFAGKRTAARPRVLFLCSDRGTAYLQTIFDRRWVTWRTAADQPQAQAHATVTR